MYNDIISIENLLLSWQEFLRGKRRKQGVAAFDLHRMDALLALHHDLAAKTYRHRGYESFVIADPKPRNISKASVRDRLVHHALYRQLYWFFDKKFIHDSYSCRKHKGTHKALQRFRDMAHTVGKNDTRTVWTLKCDIKKFFASIDHDILTSILQKHIHDTETTALFENIIHSFHTPLQPGVGLPLGNLTSQLLVNIYMNEFDQWVKHVLKARYYIRYADDFVFFSHDQSELQHFLSRAQEFLEQRLRLVMHPDKVFIATLASGVDFLGWVHFPHHRVLRTATKKRMMRTITKYRKPNTIASYKGMLRHGNAYSLERMLQDI